MFIPWIITFIIYNIPKNKDEYTKLLSEIEINYIGIVKAYYNRNLDIAHKIANDRGKLIKKSDQFFNDNRDAQYIGFLVYNTKSLISNINAIARTIYQGMPS